LIKSSVVDNPISELDYKGATILFSEDNVEVIIF